MTNVLAVVLISLQVTTIQEGKSSVLIAIYYCLGFEEIIGGLNEKVLTSAYKNQIEDKDTSWPVLESGAYLEISNGTDEITIYRSAKHETRDSKLVTVYFSKIGLYLQCRYNE